MEKGEVHCIRIVLFCMMGVTHKKQKEKNPQLNVLEGSGLTEKTKTVHP
jgi:hypothetical protein